MPDLPFTPLQVLALRSALGVPDGAPDPTADDLIVVLAAQQIAEREARKWTFGWHRDPPEDP